MADNDLGPVHLFALPVWPVRPNAGTQPTKPGYYWWRQPGDGLAWEPAEVATGLTGLVNVCRMGIELDKPLSSGSWGPEIVPPE